MKSTPEETDTRSPYTGCRVLYVKSMQTDVSTSNTFLRKTLPTFCVSVILEATPMR